MKRNLIAIAGNQAFKITSVRDYKYIVVGRRNVAHLLTMRDNFAPSVVEQWEQMQAAGKQMNYLLDCWTTRMDLADKKATALKNINYKGIPAYVDVQIIEVKPHFGVK